MGIIRSIFLIIIVSVLIILILPIQLLINLTNLKIKYKIPKLFLKIVSYIIGLKIRSINLRNTNKNKYGVLYVSNHVSWMDILCLGSLLDAQFIAKKEVAEMGLFGFLAKLNHTFFIDNTNQRKSFSYNEIIQAKIIHHLKKCPGYDVEKNYFFPDSISGKKLTDFSETLRKLPCDKFDITFLSLGEDGHLAGHFIDSQFLDDKRFCYTNNAEKLPRERISFSIPWLMKSKVIILAVFGENKKKALEELADGSGLHSKIWNMNNLVLMTDQDLEKEKIR